MLPVDPLVPVGGIVGGRGVARGVALVVVRQCDAGPRGLRGSREDHLVPVCRSVVRRCWRRRSTRSVFCHKSYGAAGHVGNLPAVCRIGRSCCSGCTSPGNRRPRCHRGACRRRAPTIGGSRRRVAVGVLGCCHAGPTAAQRPVQDHAEAVGSGVPVGDVGFVVLSLRDGGERRAGACRSWSPAIHPRRRVWCCCSGSSSSSTLARFRR